jgi:DNA-directed RNA polymerase subunit RPC12/RpoP
MAIKYGCTCGKKFSAEDRYAGRRTRCAHCGREFEIPMRSVREREEPPELPGPAVQFESREDAVKKAKAKAVAGSPNVVPGADSVPSTVKRAQLALTWKTSAVALCVLVGFVLCFLAYSFLTAGSRVQPAVGVQSSSTAPDPGGIARTVSAPTYKILKSDGDAAKDVFYVRLREKVSKDVLAGLAHEIRRKGSTGKERTVIFVYLPQVDAFEGGSFGPPWAIADFDPGLKIEVCGLNAEQEAELLASPIGTGRDVIGRWIEDSDGDGLYTIYRKDGLLYLETKRSPRGGLSKELVEAGYPAGQRFERKKFSKAGDHYLINRKGDLEVRDNQGLITVCKKVK